MISQKTLRYQVEQWYKFLPYIKPYYAVKSNPDENIIKWLYTQKTQKHKKNEIGFDCASPKEIDQVIESLGNSVIKEDIIYANPHKSERDILYAKSRNINKTTIDSCEGLDDIVSCNWHPDIFIRIAVDDSNSSSPFSIKFGAKEHSYDNIINHAFSKNINIAGISFHVGSGSQSPMQYYNAIMKAQQLTEKIHNKYKKSIHPEFTIDIGGGFLHTETEFTTAAKHINMAFIKWLKYNNSTYPKKIIAEPGRYFSAPTHTLYTPIIHKKKTEKGYTYVIDESIYGQFSSIIFDHAKPYYTHIALNNHNKENKENKEKINKTEGIIFGRTCDSIDMIAHSHSMQIMEKGDYLCFKNMGAYTRASASEFNGFPNPLTIYQGHKYQDHICDDEKTVENVTFPISLCSSLSLSY